MTYLTGKRVGHMAVGVSDSVLLCVCVCVCLCVCVCVCVCVRACVIIKASSMINHNGDPLKLRCDPLGIQQTNLHQL